MSKDILNSDFYINVVGVLDWLKNDDIQIIRFNNRFEYKCNNKLHRDDGPAVEFFNGIGNQYYLNGNKLSNEEYVNFKRKILIEKML